MLIQRDLRIADLKNQLEEAGNETNRWKVISDQNLREAERLRDFCNQAETSISRVERGRWKLVDELQVEKRKNKALEERNAELSAKQAMVHNNIGDLISQTDHLKTPCVFSVILSTISATNGNEDSSNELRFITKTETFYFEALSAQDAEYSVVRRHLDKNSIFAINAVHAAPLNIPGYKIVKK